MNIKNQTMYDKDLIINYNKYYLNNFLKKNFIIVAIITLGFTIYMFTQRQWKYGIFLIGILGFYFALTYLMQSMTTKRILKKSPLVEHPVLQTYIFTETEIQIENVKTKVVPYTEIIKILNTKNFLILSDVNKKTYIVYKKGFESEADLETLQIFLKTKYGKSYH